MGAYKALVFLDTPSTSGPELIFYAAFLSPSLAPEAGASPL